MSGSFEFVAPKPSARWFRDIYITEKIDGTNSAIQFDVDGNWATQSKKRLITPEDDNFGFAGWVSRNHEHLFSLLGPGLHRGEWWGKGIQRNYGLDHKVFSLFNTARWYDEYGHGLGHCHIDDQATLSVVPQLYVGTNSDEAIKANLIELEENGSVAAPGWAKAEGIVIYHRVIDQIFKVTLDNNDAGKWEVG